MIFLQFKAIQYEKFSTRQPRVQFKDLYVQTSKVVPFRYRNGICRFTFSSRRLANNFSVLPLSNGHLLSCPHDVRGAHLENTTFCRRRFAIYLETGNDASYRIARWLQAISRNRGTDGESLTESDFWCRIIRSLHSFLQFGRCWFPQLYPEHGCLFVFLVYCCILIMFILVFPHPIISSLFT